MSNGKIEKLVGGAPRPTQQQRELRRQIIDEFDEQEEANNELARRDIETMDVTPRWMMWLVSTMKLEEILCFRQEAINPIFTYLSEGEKTDYPHILDHVSRTVEREFAIQQRSWKAWQTREVINPPELEIEETWV